MSVQSYLFFNGRCREALDFYQQVLGAKVTTLMRMQDVPESAHTQPLPADAQNMVMHADVQIGDTQIMVSDGRGSAAGAPVFQGFALSHALPDEAQARQIFAALADKGNIDMPIEKTFWSPCFGMLTDRFGVKWMITVPARL